jgi:hypothetical protein
MMDVVSAQTLYGMMRIIACVAGKRPIESCAIMVYCCKTISDYWIMKAFNHAIYRQAVLYAGTNKF